jgi:hypothetical protein
MFTEKLIGAPSEALAPESPEYVTGAGQTAAAGLYAAEYIAGKTPPGPVTVVVNVKLVAVGLVLVNGITS